MEEPGILSTSSKNIPGRRFYDKKSRTKY